MSSRRYAMTPAINDPAETRNNPYGAQNILLRQTPRFPAWASADDEIHSGYQDRDYDGWRRACDLVCSKGADTFGGGFEAWVRRAPVPDVLEFAAAFFDIPLPGVGAVYGVQVVRHTNVASGYPVYHLTYWRLSVGNPLPPPCPIRYPATRLRHDGIEAPING